MNYKGAETVRLVVWQTNADPLKIARCNLALKPCGSDDSDPSCGKISVKTPLLNVVKVAAKRSNFQISIVTVLNFSMLGQQLIIKSARF